MKKKLFLLVLLLNAILIASCGNGDEATPQTTGSISGIIIDSSFHSVENATVSTSPASSQLLTKIDGSYKIEDISPGTYTVLASKTGVGSGTATIEVIAGKTTTANITLSPLPPTTGIISGVVTDSTGTPIANAEVTTNPSTSHLTSSANGTFTFSSVIPGTYIVQATQGLRTGKTSSIVTAGAVQNITIVIGLDNGPTEGLIAFYPFNNDTKDYSGNGFDLTLEHGLFAASRKGESNGGLVMNGVGPTAVGVHDQRLNPSTITISFWVKMTFPQVSGSQGMIFLSKYIVSTNNGYLFYCIGSGFFWLYGLGSSSAFCTTDKFPTDDAWHNIIGTADNNGTKLFIDGNLIVSGSWNGSPGPPTQAAPFAIGSPDTVNETPFGMIDDVRLYNRVLSPSEIQKLALDK